MRPPAGPRPRTFFPTAINTFRQCPERYYHRYIKKRTGAQPFSRPLVLGGATHRMIASVLPRYLHAGEIAADLEAQALAEVSTREYPDEERQHLAQDARDVVELTLAALELIPRRSRALLQERKLYAPLGRSGVEIGAQIDLVLQRPDGAIEHVDFKTGKVRENTVQTLLARAVVGRRFGTATEIQTTTLYLAQRQRHAVTLDRVTSRLDWQGVARTIRDMRANEHFPPTPGPLCAYCPFQSRHCSAW
jgi:RecB family exonuclease